MGVTVNWYDERQDIILATISGDWEWTEIYAMVDQIDEMMDSVPHYVGTIIDVTDTHIWRPDVLDNLQVLNAKIHPQAAHSVICGLSSPIQRLLHVFNRFYSGFINPFGVFYKPTPEEATELIRTAGIAGTIPPDDTSDTLEDLPE